jgi:general secretion pathway protein D
MAGKRIVGLAALASIAGIVVPLAAQQLPVPAPNAPAQPAPGAAQPVDPNNPPIPRQPIIPRRVPVPAPQQPAPTTPPQPGAQNAPSALSPTPPSAQERGETPAPAAPTTPPTPQRRFGSSPSAPSGGMISLNFNRADLIEIIHIIAQQLRLTYTIDPDVKGTVTINSAEPLRSEDLLPIFHQILRMNGAVAVRTGNLYHIMPIKDGKGLARPAGQNREDSFALQVIPVRFFAVAEMKRVLTPFLQPGGEIVENPRGNFLIVMDLPSNIQRLTEIAELIDVQVFAGTRMEIYQPKVASAEELGQEMTKVMQSFASSAPQAENFAAEFIALPRINQLLVISHSEAAWTYAKRWLDRIDVVADGPGRRIFIYPVENGKATDLADVLNQALGQPATGRRDSTRTLQDLHRSTAGGTTSSTGQGSMGTGSSGFGSSGSFGQQSRPLGAYAAVPVPGQGVPPGVVAPPQPPVSQAPGAARPPQSQQQQQQQQEQLRIVADPATNSLIVYGTVQEFQNVKNILKDLDAIPRQVLLDVLIAEVTLSDNESLGVDYEILARNPSSIFGQKFPSAGAIRTLGELFPTTGAFGGGISGVFGGKDIKAFVNALQSDSRFKVLSSPSILATDNRPARIQVGSQEPVATGTVSTPISTTSTGSATGFATSSTIQYQNTGRIVTIIPQVNSQGLVNLQILAEVSQINPDASVQLGTAGSFPSFDIRQAETTAVVQDGDTLVIGGIIADNRSRSRTGIPYLMDIPVIGRFFGSTTNKIDRTELIMLLTPHVIRNRDQAQQVTEDFKKSLSSLRNELDRMAKERVRLQQQPVEPKPALPGPSSDPVPPPPGASLSPFAPNAPVFARDTVLWTDVDQPSPAVVAREMPASLGGVPNTPVVTAGGQSVPQAPLYLTTFVTRPPVSQTKTAPVKRKSERQWTVQVAALADESDAKTMMQSLRKSGYDAYVTTGQATSKTWHRVRVGRFGDPQAAQQMKASLAESSPFRRAFVVAN